MPPTSDAPQPVSAAAARTTTQWPLSYSAMSMYLRCPLKFKFHYVDRLPEEPRAQWSFGSSLHRSIEYFHNERPAPAPVEKVLAHFREIWERDGYATPEEEEAHRLLGEEVLRRFVAANEREHEVRVGAEFGFRIQIDGVWLQGKVDEVRRLPDGTHEVLDYKSMADPYDDEDVAASLQLTVYQAGVEATLGKVGRLSIYNLRPGTVVSCPPRTEEQILGFRRLLRSTAEAIAARQFPPREEADCPCEFADRCPLYRDRFGIRGQTSLLETALERDGPTLVVEYAAAVGRGDGPGREAAAQRVLEYAEARQVTRVFGAEQVITLRPGAGPAGTTSLVLQPRVGQLAARPPARRPVP